MTKEELLSNTHIVRSFNGEAVYVQMMALNKFFESNVVIPKGENRHPYADVLHEWVEGRQVECRYLANDSFEWKNNLTLPSLDYEYRIKPSEPVYEWQFVYIKADNTAGITCFYTDEESKDCYQFTKIQKTKRERK